ncbi:periplasmic heavy metal sensor [Halovulum sp. GXIMD14793]
MAGTDNPGAKAQCPAWMRWLLVVSLALNLAGIGLLGGAALRKPPQAVEVPSPNAEFQLYVSAMPGEHRKAIRRAFYEKLESMRPHRQEMLERRSQVIALLRQAEFDQAALGAMMEAQHAGWTEIGRWGRVLILEQIEVMTPQDRSRLADNLEKSPNRRDHRWDRGRRSRDRH